MSRIYLKSSDDKRISAYYFIDGKRVNLEEEYLSSFLSMVTKLKNIQIIEHRIEDTIELVANRDSMIIVEAKRFLEEQKDSEIGKFINANRLSSKKDKPIIRDNSISIKGGKKLALFLITCGIILLGTDAYFEIKDRNDEKNIDGEMATVIMETTPMPTYESEFTIISNESSTSGITVVPSTTSTPYIYSNEEISALVLEYARTKNIDENLVKRLIEQNGIYQADRIDYYKKIVDFMAFARDKGFSLDVYAFNKKAAVICTSNNGRFIVLPAKNEVHSMVQVCPDKWATSTTAYSEILDHVRNGDFPEYMIMGSSNSEPDFLDNSNGNVLLDTINFMNSMGFNINNLGIMGVGYSGESALLNAGHVLNNYPQLGVRVVGLDSYGLDAINAEIDQWNNNQNTSYGSEIRGLINGNPEIVLVVPSRSGNGISDQRPSEALNQGMSLGDRLGGVTIIASNNTDHNSYYAEAMRKLILDYLAGKTPIESTIDGSTYYIPSFSYNSDNESFEYPEENINDNINDIITFG